jgi:hypothetical protein
MLTAATLVENEDYGICMAKVLAAQLATSSDWELDHLVFVEFLEAASRIAVLTQTGIEDVAKVKLAFTLLSECGARRK